MASAVTVGEVKQRDCCSQAAAAADAYVAVAVADFAGATVSVEAEEVGL